jgi:asparagine synthase (glutamine-hydrolysing)
MCGIVGFVGRLPEDCSAAIVERMARAVAHRGPDARRITVLRCGDAGGRVALGAARLEIVDRQGGGQPFVDSVSGEVLVFNGEIYNHADLRRDLAAQGAEFRTGSDTEVLLRLLQIRGEAGLQRIEGMFAFALWRPARQELVLARDVFGEKPLLYMRDGWGLAFGSELCALTRHPAWRGAVDGAALAQHLIWRYVPGDRTLSAAVLSAPPGHVLRWRADGSLARIRFATISDPSAKSLTNPAEAARALRAALEGSVRLRRQCDRATGVLLSGGVDSSSVAALMARDSDRPIQAFTAGFSEAAFSELPAARRVAARLRADLVEYILTPDACVADLEEATLRRGAPLLEMSDLALYGLSRCAAQSVRVVLGGEGADEILAGYPKHRAEAWIGWLSRILPVPTASQLLRRMLRGSPVLPRALVTAIRSAAEPDFVARQAMWFAATSRDEAPSLFPGLDWKGIGFGATEEQPAAAASALRRALACDQHHWLAGAILPRADAMTMAHGVEARLPFLAPEVVSLAGRLPDALLVRGGHGKVALRAAMAGLVPAETLAGPKIGFRPPTSVWFRGPLRDFVQAMLLDEGSRIRGFSDRGAVSALIAEHASGRRDHGRSLWTLVALEAWLRAFDVRFDARSSRG